jgi:tripartite-type tricarboxylate transporter receptor subunit TctC
MAGCREPRLLAYNLVNFSGGKAFVRLAAIVPLAVIGCVAGSTGALCAQSPDPAATFPSRPIRLVSGFTSGGPPDAIGRIVASKLTELLGQQGIVDNRPGAGSPRPITEKLNRTVLAVFQMPDVQSRYAALGVEISPTTPTEFDKFVGLEITRIAKLARAAGIKPQ